MEGGGHIKQFVSVLADVAVKVRDQMGRKDRQSQSSCRSEDYSKKKNDASTSRLPPKKGKERNQSYQIEGAGREG